MWSKIDFCITATLMVCFLSVALATSDMWETTGQFSYNLMKEENFKIHDTKLFRYGQGLHVRHDLEIHLALQLHDHCDESFVFWLIENENSTIFTWIQRPLVQNGKYHFHLHVNKSIPVGPYTLNGSNPCFDEKVHLCNVNVMFNPSLTERDTSGDKRIRRQLLPLEDPFFDEYLRNNDGYIWRWSTSIPWKYAVGSLAVTVSKNLLMEQMTPIERLNPILYSRALTRLIGDHVLEGRWDVDFPGGVDPSQWVGSEEILTLWLTHGQKVRYAQCWVFAAILTTILRASGIPARTVTNYNSHRDKGILNIVYDGRALIRQYDNIIQPDERQWNFHVWTEAWLERPDLGESADWNALDATPQEPSPLFLNQPYRTGPAYVPYIRLNRIYANYDTHFVQAEVNAYGICSITGEVLPSNIGYAVVTKLPGKNNEVYNFSNPDYITNNYKINIQPVVKRASDSANPELPPPYTGCERDGGMRLNIIPTSPSVGEDFTITVTEGNVPVEDIVIQMELRNYMGESLGLIRNFTGTRDLTVTEDDYLPYLSFTSIFRFSVGVYNNAGGFVFHDDLRITLEYDQLEVEATRLTNSDTITLVLMYTNPLSVAMTGVMVNVAGPNNTYSMIEQPDIPANSDFTTTVSLQCGDNEDSDVMIPVSLDSGDTESVHGVGWSSCSRGPSNGGIVMPSEISGLQMMLFCLFALFLCSQLAT